MDAARIRATKVGGIWHGLVDGHPTIDERAFTEEIARRKAKDALQRGLERAATVKDGEATRS